MTEAQTEIARLIEEEKLNDVQRQAKAEQIRKDLDEWDALGPTVQEVEKELQDRQRSGASPVPS